MRLEGERRAVDVRQHRQAVQRPQARHRRGLGRRADIAWLAKRPTDGECARARERVHEEVPQVGCQPVAPRAPPRHQLQVRRLGRTLSHHEDGVRRGDVA
eukprot:5173386-Prymnesium_polylepis.1